MTCKECIHFGICKKGFPWADGKGGGWCEDFRLNPDFVKLKPQPIEASADLNEIEAAGVYGVDLANASDFTAIRFKETEVEALTKAIEYMRAQGYIVEATKSGFIIKGKAEAQT